MLRTYLKHFSLLAAITALVMLTHLGGARLWDRDEPRNAGCAREMLALGEWVVPYFNGELRTHKPVLLYWCIMAAYSTLGVSEFAARLPSGLAAIGTVLLTYSMGRRLFGIRAGLWAGIALATSLMFVLAGRAATPDSLLIFCTTLALTIYVRGTFRPRFDTTPLDAPPQLKSGRLAPRDESISRSEMPTLVGDSYFPQHWPTALAMYAAMGLAVLAKGPVGLILPTAVIGLFVLIARLPKRNATEGVPYRLLALFEPLHFLTTCWLMRPFTAIFAAAAVALPWYWAVGLATDGEFLRGFFFEHNLARATSPMENHGGTIVYYPTAILVGFFPWTIFAIPLTIDTVLQLRRAPSVGRSTAPSYFHAGYLLAVCWIAVYVVLFSIARTKLPSYVTPCYPALALLAGDYIDRWSRQGAAVAGGWLLAAFTCLALVGMGIAVAIPLVAKQQLPGEEWLGLIGLLPIAGGVACLGLAAVRSYQAAATALAATAVAFAIFLFTVGADRLDRHQTNHQLLQAIYSRSVNPQMAAYKVLEPSWVFYGGRAIHEFTTRPGQPSRQVAHETVQFLATSPDAYVITTAQKAAELSPLLPAGIGPIAETPYFLRKKQTLVVLGHQHAPAALTSHHAALPTHPR